MYLSVILLLLFLMVLKYFCQRNCYLHQWASYFTKKPPDSIILDICVLGSFISADKLFSNTFLNFVFYLVVNSSSWDNLHPPNILLFILSVTPVWSLAGDFSLFNCESDNLTFTLLYSVIYILALKNLCCSFAKFQCSLSFL